MSSKVKEEWRIYGKKADFMGISRKYGISPVIARIMRNRDVDESEIDSFLHGRLEDIADPALFKDAVKAAGILEQAIADKKKIRIVGDYDADGICSTAVLKVGLTRLGGDVDFVLPHRVRDGYGINPDMIRKAKEDDIGLIITCDNGIAASEPARLARDLGIQMVVTDHHTVPYEDTPEGPREILPDADAIVDPKQSACTYPFKGMCGAGVAWQLIRLLYRRAGLNDKEWLPLVEFAAIATVADVMELRGENRILVKCGLELLHHSSWPGLRALMLAADIDAPRLKSWQLGFIIGPCLNASGRMDTAVRALNLLLETDEQDAAEAAVELRNLNEERKDLTEKGVAQACEIADSCEDRVLVIYLPECHESLAGIIAGKVRERFQKPCLVLTDGTEGVKGSGRSIEHYDMYAELHRCADLLDKFGGHTMAAGLSLHRENIEPLRRRLNENCTLTEADFVRRIWIDTELPIQYATRELIRQMELLEPLGNGNETPLFAARGLHVLSFKVLGRNRNACRFELCDDAGARITAMYFTDGDELTKLMNETCSQEETSRAMRGLNNHIRISCLYCPAENTFRDVTTVQMNIKGIRFTLI